MCADVKSEGLFTVVLMTVYLTAASQEHSENPVAASQSHIADVFVVGVAKWKEEVHAKCQGPRPPVVVLTDSR